MTGNDRLKIKIVISGGVQTANYFSSYPLGRNLRVLKCYAVKVTFTN